MKKKKIFREKVKNAKGITLIALVITIIILLILAGISIASLFGDNGLLGKAEESKFKAKMSAIAEQWDLYVAGYAMDNNGQGNIKDLYAGGQVLKDYIADEEIDVPDSSIQDIRDLLDEVGAEEEKYSVGFQGDFCYVSQSTIPNNAKQEQWCREIGIKILGYEGNTGIKVVNGNYEKVNGVYLCTPKLNTGFVKEKTRYVKLDSNGKLVPGTWINKKPEDDWYSYKEQKWANLYVESNGIESYYVWIPRYVYKISETETERMDVKFVDINNNFTDAETDVVTTWAELQEQGYQIPEAFYYGDNEDNYQSNTPIPGYWMSKYQLSELKNEDNYTIDFSTTATPSAITIKDITVHTTKAIGKYVYAINGNIVHESTNGENYEAKDLARGNKAVNVTILDPDGQIIGSMTKLYETADVNPPDLTGFDQDTTFYVYWDENGIEHNEIPISQDAPDEWYALDHVSDRSYVKFIKGTGTETDDGYQIPEAFSWGDNNEKQLTGYWMSKYQLSTEPTTPKIDAEMTAGSSVIRVKEIKGTAVTDGLKYEYYINGKKVYDGTNQAENYAYTGLQANTTYTVTIIARKSDDTYVGGITKKIKTVEANKPDLAGFNENNTYYVLYDDDYNMSIGDKVKNNGSNAPKNNWYDYTKSKWANIVVTDGTVSNGQITGGTYKNYFVWIPRYEYRILQDRDNESTENRRIEVNFLQGTETNTTPGGYKIPEAFYWGDNNEKPISGYWMSKYQLSDK